MRRSFALLALTAIFALTACVGTEKVIDPEALTIMGKKSDLEKPYMTKIFDLYKTATGNSLNLIAYEDSEYETKASEKFMQGEIPDIFMHFHNADLNRFGTENFFRLNDESWVTDLTESARAYCTDDEGNLLGLPFWESSVSGCYYNKTLFNQLGLKPATSQREFDLLCQSLLEIEQTPICWPANGCTWMYQFGLDPIFADDPSLSLLEQLNQKEIKYSDIPEVGNMVKWIANAAEKKWFGADFLKMGWDDISTSLGSGNCAMTFIWDTWFYTDFAEGQKFSINDFAVMPIFMNTVEGGTFEGGNLNMMMVNQNGKKLQKALEFLEFCATEENYNAAFEGISTVSCFRGQKTNIQSQMVTEAEASIAKKERVSTAATKIFGYSADDVASAFQELFRGKTDVAGCIRMMDEFRLSEMEKQDFNFKK